MLTATNSSLELRTAPGKRRPIGGVCILAAILFTMLALPVFAEPDNGKFLPRRQPFSVDNIYLALEPRLQIPLSFAEFNMKSMTIAGFGISGEAGYNWDGWLFGLTGGFSHYGKGTGQFSRMIYFNTITTGVRLSRVLSSRTLKFLPDWLELVPYIGMGAQFIQSDYYRSDWMMQNGIVTHVDYKDVVVLYTQLGLHVDFYLGTDYAIPYVGLEYAGFIDRVGIGNLPSVFLGVRSYPFGLFTGGKERRAEKKAQAEEEARAEADRKAAAKKSEADRKAREAAEKEAAEKAAAEKAEADRKAREAADKEAAARAAKPAGPPKLNIVMNTQDFTPDGDGENDKAVFKVNGSNLGDKYRGWDLTIFDPKGKKFKTMKGNGLPPKRLTWDGYSDRGEIVTSASIYPVIMNILAKDGGKLTAKSKIVTGILVERLPDGTLRIRVSSIFFDPSASTFNRISQEQRDSNKYTLDKVTEQIKRYPQYNLVIEGHANNTSGTEEENIKDLIPLSKHRAETIATELNKRGVPWDRMSTVGLGGSFPIVPRELRDEWWKNRRVEFLLKK